MYSLTSKGEVDRILELNEKSMDSHPTIACTARMTKDLFPITEIVFKRELERDSNAAIEGYSNFVQSLLINLVMVPYYCGHPECSKEMMEKIKQEFISHFDKTIEQIPAILNDLKKEENETHND